MAHVLEAIFRRPLQLLLLIILFPLIGLGVAYFLPRSYQSTASLWALRRYEIVGATGPESNLLATPADTQSTSLTELLQSRTFALSVADEAGLASTLSPDIQANPLNRDDTMYTDISKGVLAASQGYNLYVVTYSNKNPYIAQKVVAAVIRNYSLQSVGFSVIEGQRLSQAYQKQLVQAKAANDAAVQAESQFIKDHPTMSHADLLNDPQYAQLHSQTLQAQATLTGVQTNIATLDQEMSTLGNNSADFFKVLDPPVIPDRAVSRTKVLLVAGGIGAGVGIVSCIVFLALMVRRDQTIRTKVDLQKVTAYPLIMQLPHLTRASGFLVIEGSTHNEQNQQLIEGLN